MGFTAWLALIYAALAVLTFSAFRKNMKGAGYALMALMTVGVIVLGYMWITSPM